MESHHQVPGDSSSLRFHGYQQFNSPTIPTSPQSQQQQFPRSSFQPSASGPGAVNNCFQIAETTPRSINSSCFQQQGVSGIMTSTIVEEPGVAAPEASPQYRIYKRGDSIPGIHSPPIIVSALGGGFNNNNATSSVSHPPVPAPLPNIPKSLPRNQGKTSQSPLTMVAALGNYHRLNPGPTYHLISTEGPPHCPTFTVELKLTEDEKYEGIGGSIKKAQLSAATKALQETRLERPPPGAAAVTRASGQQIRNHKSRFANNSNGPRTNRMLPCTEAAASQRRSNQTSYTQNLISELRNLTSEELILSSEPVTMTPEVPGISSPSPAAMTVKLQLGPNNPTIPPFTATGTNFNALRIDVLKRAIHHFNPNFFANSASGNPRETRNETNATANPNVNKNKNPISILYEIVNQRRLSVSYAVISETGPAHSKLFTMKCVVTGRGVVGISSTSSEPLETIGTGSTKQESKKSASESMILRIRAVLSSNGEQQQHGAGSGRPVRRYPRYGPGGINGATIPSRKVQYPVVKTIVTTGENSSNNGAGGTGTPLTLAMNPISRVIQVAQQHHWDDPIWRTISANELPLEQLQQEATTSSSNIAHQHQRQQPMATARSNQRRPNFGIEVTAGPHRAVGTGPNKKIAKKDAAEKILAIIFPSSTSKSEASAPGDNNTSENSSNPNPSNLEIVSGRQLVPGLLAITVPKDQSSGIDAQFSQLSVNLSSQSNGTGNGNSSSTAAAAVSAPVPVVVDQLQLQENHQPTPVAPHHSIQNQPISTSSVSNNSNTEVSGASLNKLKYLSSLLELSISWNDFPRKSGYLSVLSLSTDDGPRVCHGVGATVKDAREQAAMLILVDLEKQGLDSLITGSSNNDPGNLNSTNCHTEIGNGGTSSSSSLI